MRGCDTLVVDMGVLGLPAIEPDLSRQTVVGTVGERIEALAAGGDRGRAVAAMTRGVERILPELHAQGRFGGVIGIGGGGGGAGGRGRRWRRPVCGPCQSACPS